VTGPGAPGVWQAGRDPGHRRFVELGGPGDGGFQLESGGCLESVTVAYETWGEINGDGTNAVLVLHALTGDSHVAGPSGPAHPSPGWWDRMVGPGAAIDTDRFFVVCPNVLGGCQGTTGPSSPAGDGRPYGSRFPFTTIRDQVAVEVALADHLGIDRWYAAIGGSMGGMRVLEWACGEPGRLARAVVLAAGAEATAEQIGLCALQVRAIRGDPAFAGGDYYESASWPLAGMALARGIGQVSYRTPEELQERFGRQATDEGDRGPGGRFAVASYLEHHGEKLSRYFDPNSYIALSEAMNHHDVGRGRGGVAAALAKVTAVVTVAGIASDRLYPFAQQVELAALLPGRRPAAMLQSASGHDGFLLETEQVGGVIVDGLSP
jgi:homoserine O-acetyltransferase